MTEFCDRYATQIEAVRPPVWRTYCVEFGDVGPVEFSVTVTLATGEESTVKGRCVSMRAKYGGENDENCLAYEVGKTGRVAFRKAVIKKTEERKVFVWPKS